MSRNLVARAATRIAASPDTTWKALVTPEAIKQYMFGADVSSGWKAGSTITWRGEIHGRSYEDHGVIVKIEPRRILQYTHFSPLSGQPDRPENYHTVTIELSGTDLSTEVSLSQDNNADESARAESEKNWAMMLAGLKKYVEGGPAT